jgi:hypothetical protein
VLTATSGLLHKVDVLVVAPDRIPMLPEGLPEISTTADAIATPESLQTFARTGCASLIRSVRAHRQVVIHAVPQGTTFVV